MMMLLFCAHPTEAAEGPAFDEDTFVTAFAPQCGGEIDRTWDDDRHLLSTLSCSIEFLPQRHQFSVRWKGANRHLASELRLDEAALALRNAEDVALLEALGFDSSEFTPTHTAQLRVDTKEDASALTTTWRETMTFVDRQIQGGQWDGQRLVVIRDLGGTLAEIVGRWTPIAADVSVSDAAALPDEATAIAAAGIESANYIGLRPIFVPDTLDVLGRVTTGRQLHEVSWRHFDKESDKVRAVYLQGTQSLGVDPGGVR